jgi:enoyl-CoA hydratase
MEIEIKNSICVITMDDGKANAIGHTMLDHLNAGLDQAEQDAKAVLLVGREGLFSAGFDLKEFKKGPEATRALARRGFELLLRLYGYPLPLVSACSGHGIALGAFILLASDTRVGVSGDFKITLPETAISMDLPPCLMELVKQRIASTHITRAAIQAEVYTPEGAVDAGFLDEVVAPEALLERSMAIAEKLAALPQKYYAINKQATRSASLAVMEANLP